jgi:hypothetical protein
VSGEEKRLWSVVQTSVRRGLCCGKLRVFDLDNDRDFLLLMAQLPIKEQLMILTRDYDSNMNTEP